MGCNYYAIPKATLELKHRIIEAVVANDFTLASQLLPEKIHIGKSSMGWKFLFNHNDWQFFEKSKQSLEDFLHGCEIYDENNKSLSNREFWEWVLGKQNNMTEIAHGTMEFGFNFSNFTVFS